MGSAVNQRDRILGLYEAPRLLKKNKSRQKKFSGIALALHLSDMWVLELVAKIRSRFPKASRKEIEDRLYRHICRLEKIHQRTRVVVKRCRDGRLIATVVRGTGSNRNLSRRPKGGRPQASRGVA
ncbi:MAG: hypothetical protein ACREBU_22165 [Nitrososphaera sp.]